MERRVLGLRIPRLLPDGDYSVLNRLGNNTAPEGSSHERKLSMQERILEALDSLEAEGISEASGYQIRRRAEELRPPKHWWNMIGFGTLYRGLDQLKGSGEIADRKVRYLNPDDPKAPKVNYLFHRVKPEPTDTEQK